ncbi:YXWGXW repeat-containing protein [Variovorax sp. E3]|uniref:YXWGXW repeat-containing protein n=1 Tax=Variovorax sp. E3 TaxID=1914993 RepID=UPI0018DBCFF5|nr:YXWGXW repeat-containing protein [Variovorax sp. E3]
MKKIALAFSIGAASLLSVGALTVPTAAQAQPAVTIQVAPPAPRFERVPPPRRGYVWAPGHYEWRGGRHVWMGGYWVRARPGYAYRPPEWRQDGGRWQYNAGRWDRDGDGVPNRYDRRPNNPYRN